MVFKISTRIHTLISDFKRLVKLIRNTSKHMRNNKNDNLEHVDLENGIIHGVLKQIRHSTFNIQDPKQPDLTSVWCCDISPLQTKLLITFIREFVTPYDDLSLVHVKRFNKILKNNTPELRQRPISILQTIICSANLFNNEEEILALIKEQGNIELNNGDLKFYQRQIPKNPAETKEISQEWSSNYWPMAWKGNPNHQILKSNNFNISQERAMINKLLDFLRDKQTTNCNDVPVVTIIAKPSNGVEEHKILSVSFDDRNTHPLEHSVIKAIKEIAENERIRRAGIEPTNDDIDKDDLNYLCHNLLVYTTHEPCVMCSMALVHSRIGRVIYLKDVPETGGLTSNYQLGDRDGLNWKYEIWKWTGKEELQRLNDMVNNHQNNGISNDRSPINF